MKTFIKLLMLTCISAILVLGCEEVLTNADITDEEALDLLITDRQDYFDSQNHYGEEDTTDVRLEFREPINTFFWFRELQTAVLNYEIYITGDSAYVEFAGDYTGDLNIFAAEDPVELFLKDFEEHSTRNAVFKRLEDVDDDPLTRRGWRLTDVTGAETGPGNQSVRIDSVRLNCYSYPDTVFTDPSAMFSKYDLITLYPEERCSLTVYTNFDGVIEQDLVFLHSWRRYIPHFRTRFEFVEDGVYAGVWFAPANTGNALSRVHHTAFDMIKYETLLDDEYQYDSNAWSFPYQVSIE